MDKPAPLAQVIRGTEQLSDAQLKEQTRWYIPSAIERLAQLCNSKNEGVALGAIKVMIAKNIPDLKAIELSGDDKQPLLVVNLDALKSIAQRTDKLPTKAE